MPPRARTVSAGLRTGRAGRGLRGGGVCDAGAMGGRHPAGAHRRRVQRANCRTGPRHPMRHSKKQARSFASGGGARRFGGPGGCRRRCPDRHGPRRRRRGARHRTSGQLYVRPVIHAIAANSAPAPPSTPPPPPSEDLAQHIADEKQLRQSTDQQIQLLALQFQATRCGDDDVLAGNDDPELPLITCSSDGDAVYLLGESLLNSSKSSPPPRYPTGNAESMRSSCLSTTSPCKSSPPIPLPTTLKRSRSPSTRPSTRHRGSNRSPQRTGDDHRRLHRRAGPRTGEHAGQHPAAPRTHRAIIGYGNRCGMNVVGH